MSKHFGVAQTITLVEQLREFVRDFTAREEKLNQEFRGKFNIEQQRRDQASEESAARLSAEMAQARETFAETKTRLEAKFTTRKAWLAKAQWRSQKQALKKIDDREGGRKTKLQMDTMQSHRNRDTGLATVQKTCETFSQDVFAEEDKLSQMEEKAKSAFRGYGAFQRLLATAPRLGEAELSRDENELFVELRNLLNKAQDDLSRFRRSLLPHIFKRRLLLGILVLLQIPAVPLLQHFGIDSFTYQHAIGSAGGLLVLGFLLHLFSRRQGDSQARGIAGALTKGRKLVEVCREKAEQRYKNDYERTVHEFEDRIKRIEQDWSAAVDEAARLRESRPCELNAKAARANARNAEISETKQSRLQQEHTVELEKLQQQADERKSAITRDYAEREARLNADSQSRWQEMESEWKTLVAPVYARIEELNAAAEQLFPPWTSPTLTNWKSPERFAHATQVGRWQVDVEKLAGGLPKDPRLSLAGATRFSLPVTLAYPNEGSLLIETTETGHDAATAALNNAVLRLLSVAAPGRVSFTIVDPVGLGQNFAGIMHLSDYAEHLINNRIWTQAGQIEQRLGELNEHMEKVIQMYLRNEYATIAEYNEQAGNIAEKYHFLVVADFPTNFTDIAARRLLSIAASGARCGVYTLIHWNANHTLPSDFIPEELRKSSVCINAKEDRLFFTGRQLPGTNIVLDTPPSAEIATEFINRVGVQNRDSNRIEVPFSHVAPEDSDIWSEDTTTELRVPIGRTGATKLQYLEIGRGTRQHALLAGKTGSGKSTLFHVLITNLALWCSPEQVEFYLIDFKKGVEFKCYATKKLPHARVIAIESDREFGLSVLQRLDDELRRRGELFRKLGVQDIAGYKRAGGTEPIPRSLLLIDEFQEFFVEDDKISQGASVLLDRIVRQGRAFGIHVILGSQTLGGAYTMARTTIGQMVIRIALQCNEADAYLIMDDSNPAPRLLSRPGEGIYNDEAGAMHGNSPFQTVWLPDGVRDSFLERVQAEAVKTGKVYRSPVVFEGNAPADVRENEPLQALLRGDFIPSTAPLRFWLGAPNAIKGPTEVVFQRQSGNHLLLVGQNEEAVLAMYSLGLIALTAQRPSGGARFIVFDSNPTGSTHRAYLERVVRTTSAKVEIAKSGDMASIMNELAAEMKRRQEDEQVAQAPAIFLFIQGLQKFSKLRYEEDFSFSSDDSESASPSTQLNKLICEGASLGIHVVVSCDSYNNVNRFLSKKALSEFGMRIVFQMSANDSASLIDNPKASTLGMHRALFFHEQEGHLETFRPYALPGGDWIEAAVLTS
ncbi:MAG: ATP-binding protein [Verrucomicrobia bacterium]|nr:ATP-binding protein [Verrucomicrobiota bacterium]